MSARVIPTRRTLWAATWRLARIVYLRWSIKHDENYYRACARDGVLEEPRMDALRRRIRQHECALLIAENN